MFAAVHARPWRRRGWWPAPSLVGMSGLSGPAAIAAGLGAAAGIYLCVSSKQDGKRHLKKPLGKDRLHKLDPQLQSIVRRQSFFSSSSSCFDRPACLH